MDQKKHEEMQRLEEEKRREKERLDEKKKREQDRILEVSYDLFIYTFFILYCNLYIYLCIEYVE